MAHMLYTYNYLQAYRHTITRKIRCACSTLDCYAERRKFCEADTQCYVENLSSVVTRGCIDDKTPILCDNRKSTKLAHLDFPLLYCCKEEFCNRRVVPTEQPCKYI
ncbi:hypothetical protein MAR_006573 [Mya arenaria]|uniref:Activin types I and II receptor domain-containing protein n=1 Tax=Mya arenaria TaxID=6604 RepID=A0ABY7D8Y0_MYAAR|nr:hypothetical protein MAR_006573 [Mya arenaria]